MPADNDSMAGDVTFTSEAMERFSESESQFYRMLMKRAEDCALDSGRTTVEASDVDVVSRAILGPPQPREPAAGTVRVRAAVFRTEDGRWMVSGKEDHRDEYYHEFRTVLAFIEADVPWSNPPTITAKAIEQKPESI
jgi:hypothetical protein